MQTPLPTLYLIMFLSMPNYHRSGVIQIVTNQKKITSILSYQHLITDMFNTIINIVGFVIINQVNY